MLNKQIRIFKYYKKHGYSDTDKMRLDTFREECNKSIEKAKENYLKEVDLDLADPQVRQNLIGN